MKQIKNMLDEEIRTNVRFLIDEELGISDDIIKHSRDISEKIINCIKVSKPSSRYDDYNTRVFSFDDIFVDNHITFDIECINFFNKEGYFKWKNINSNIKIGDSEYKNGKYTIHIIAIFISGQLKREYLENTIAHELTHVYEHIRGNKNLFNLSDLYKESQNCLDSEYFELRLASFVIYFSEMAEIDAMSHELYNSLLNSKTMTPSWNIVKKSELYNNLVTLVNAINKLERLDDEKCENIRVNFKTSVKNIILIGKNGIKKYERKIGKMLIKYNQHVLSTRRIRFDIQECLKNDNIKINYFND